MKCDRVLSSLATGGAIARWRARRHVAPLPSGAPSAGPAQRDRA